MKDLLSNNLLFKEMLNQKLNSNMGTKHLTKMINQGDMIKLMITPITLINKQSNHQILQLAVLNLLQLISSSQTNEFLSLKLLSLDFRKIQVQ